MTGVNARPLKEILDAMACKDAADIALVSKAYEFSRDSAHRAEALFGRSVFRAPRRGRLSPRRSRARRATRSPPGFLHDVDRGRRREARDDRGALRQGSALARRRRDEARHACAIAASSGTPNRLRKLFAATAKDIRVLIIKLMDRLHNARTLEFVPEDREAHAHRAGDA